MSIGSFFVSTSECSARLSDSTDRVVISLPLFHADQKHKSDQKHGGRGCLWRNKKESRHRCEATSLAPRRNSFSHYRGGNGNEQRNDSVIHNSAAKEGLLAINIVGHAASSTLLKTRGSRRKWSLTDIFFRRCKSEGEKLERDEMELSFSSYARMSTSSDKDEERTFAQGNPAHTKKMADTTTNRSGSILTPNRMAILASAQELHRVPSANRRGVPASPHGLHHSPSPDRRGVSASTHEFHRAPSPNRRGVRVSAHELHYTANRAQSAELRRKTFLPYKQGVLGCLRFPSPPAWPQGHVLQSQH